MLDVADGVGGVGWGGVRRVRSGSDGGGDRGCVGRQAARADTTLRNDGAVEDLHAAADAALLSLRASARRHVTRIWARPAAT